MKKILSVFLILGFVVLGLTTSCKGSVNGTKDDDAKGDDTTTTTPATPTTPGPQTPQIITGTPVTSSDGILTVTPRSDGLLIQASFTQPWKHITFCIQENTANEWHASVENDPQINTSNGQSTCSLLYPFTQKDVPYKIWFNRMGNADDEWADWTSTENTDAVNVTGLGGLGNIEAMCDNDGIQYFSPRRGFYMPYLYINKPQVNLQEKFVFRAEKDGRWTNPEKYFHSETISDTVWFPEDDEDEFIQYLKGATKLFISVQYVFKYKNIEYAQRFCANWPAWDESTQSEIDDSNWFVDYDTLGQIVPTLPVIRINSEDSDNGFVAKPIAAHVKEQASGWTDQFAGAPDPWYVDCSITTEDQNAPSEALLNSVSGKVKVRGNWTTSYAKKSLRIKFDKKQRMFNVHTGEKYKNWVLLACFKDASLLRDAVALNMYKEFFPNYYASDSQLVEVFVNGVYWGVYLLAEQQETNTGRIDITEAKNNYTGTDIGYLIEFDSYSQYEAENEKFTIEYFNEGEQLTDYDDNVADEIQNGYTIKSDVYDVAQKNFIQDYMNKLWRICYEAAYNKKYYQFTTDYELEEYTPQGEDDDAKCQNCINKIIDTTSLADMYIFNEIVCDPDLYLTSFFMDIDFAEPVEGEPVGRKDHLLRFEAPWDFDSTMGNKRFCTTDHFETCSSPTELFAGMCQGDVNGDNGKIHANPWMLVFIKCNWFQRIVKNEWKRIKDDGNKLLSAARNVINDYAAFETRLDLNRTRWGNAVYTGELCAESIENADTSRAASAAYLKTWLEARIGEVDLRFYDIQQSL